MRINDINIINFRNYNKIFIEFDQKMNILIGNNGEGKTNILESIYVLAITKSHRAYIDKNLITSGSSFSKLNGNITSLNGKKEMELLISTKGKRVSINRIIKKRISDYISNLTVILFCPDDLDIIKGSPGVRRKYLNIEIGQLDNKYLNYINEYNELLKNKNEYLKNINYDNYNKNYIEILNNQLSDKAIKIYEYRYDYIEKLNKNIKEIYKDLSSENLEIKYLNNLDSNTFSYDLREKLLNKMNSSIKNEIFRGNSLYGPHKDDIEITLNGNSVKDYGSQGQQRLSVLSIKFAELEIFKDMTGEYPILLLDDIFSELDVYKKNSILKYLNKEIQVFITTTDINDINKEILNNARIFNISNGNIIS